MPKPKTYPSNSSAQSTKRVVATKRVAAWNEARVQNYLQTRSPESLASMLVDLENAGGHVPEFEIDETWPEAVSHLKVE